jgi:hypothetical protein
MPALGALRTTRIASAHKAQTTVWTKVGSAASYEAIVVDNTSTTLVKGPGRDVASGGQYLRLLQDDVAIASNERISDVSIRFIGKTSGGTDASQGEFRTMQVRTENYHGSPPNLYRLSSALVTYQGTWFNKDPDGRYWDAIDNLTKQMVFNRLAVFLWDNTPSSRTTYLPQISEVFVDYIVITRPTVTGPVASGETVSTKPTFDWTFNSTDGYDQSAFDIAVFSDAQYGIVGFDPAKSTAEFRASVSGGAETFDMPVSLRQNVPYRFYVRAALNQPNRGNWFSDWVFDAFTITLAPPPAPILTPQGYDVAGNRDIYFLQGKNNMLIVDDANFDTTIGNWLADVNATVTRDTAQSFIGPASMKIVATVAADASAKLAPFSVPNSKLFGVGFRARPNATLRTVRLLAEFLNGASAVVGTITAQVTESAVAWTAFTVAQGVSPATTVSVRLIARVVGAAAGEIHWFDTIIFTPGGSPSNFAAGSLEGLARYELQKADMPRKGNLLHPNISSGGEFFESSRGWYPKNGTDQIEVSTEVPAKVGTKSIRWIPMTAGSELHICMPSDGISGSVATGFPVAAAPGRTYGSRIWVRTYSGSGYNMRAKQYFVDATGAHLGTVGDSNIVSVLATFTKLAPGNVVAPAGTLFTKLVLENTGAVTGFPVFIDMPELFEVSASYIPEMDTPGIGEELAWTPHRLSVDPDTGDVDFIRHRNDNVAQQEAWLIDFEVPIDRTRVLRIRDVALQGGEDTASDWAYAISDTPSMTGYWLKDVFDPRNNFRAQLNTKPRQYVQQINKGVFQTVAGGNPIVVSAPPGGKSFSYELAIQGEENWFKFQNMIDGNDTILIQGPLRQWYAQLIESPAVTEYDADLIVRMVTLSFVEVDAP